MEAIKHNKNEIILKAFNKYLEAIKDPKEFDKRVMQSSGENSEAKFLSYTSVLFFLSEFYDILPKDLEWEDLIHEYMIEMKNGLETSIGYLQPSLFSGTTEVAYSIYNVYRKTGSYEKVVNTLNGYIVNQVNFYLDKYENEIGNIEMTTYDSIYGFAGQGAYLLMFKEDEKVKKTLERICTFFVNMTKEIEVKGHKVPGWHIPLDKLTTKADKKQYPEGTFNLSLSHGISGPLAFMALALRAGVEVQGQREAMRKILKDLLRFSYKDESGNVYWDGRLGLQEYINGESKVKRIGRQSWCYGSVGIGRAMYLAGTALEDEEIIRFSTYIMEGIAEMPIEKWELNCDHICHGYAGVLAVMETMYKDTKNEKYKLGIDKAVDIIVKGFDPNSLFGFYNYSVKGNPIEQEEYAYEYLDDYSFLEGSLGTILALMASIYPEKMCWMRHLVID